METTLILQENKQEPRSVTELVRELIQLRPYANIEYLIQALDKVWFDHSSLPNELVEAIGAREDLEAHHLVRMISRRNESGPIKAVCDLLLKHNPTISDLRFVFNKVTASRKQIASIFADHPEATYFDLTSAHACGELEDGCREKLETRIDAMRKSPASILVQRIDRRYAQSGYRTN